MVTIAGDANVSGVPVEDDDAWGELEIVDEQCSDGTVCVAAHDEVIPFLAPRSSMSATHFYEPVSASASGAAPTRVAGAAQPAACAIVAGEAIGTCAKSAPATAATPASSSLLQQELEALFAVDVASLGEATLPVCAKLLKEHLGITDGRFRPRQQEVCLRVLQGSHTLAVCPTGWGKSLCYQFPMLVHRLLFRERRQQQAVLQTVHANRPELQSMFCVVISPLVALVADQIETIERRGALHAVSLSSQLTAQREARLLEQLAGPACMIDIVFASPEKFIAHTDFRRLLHAQRARVAFVCVDEVHCVSRWAYDFRPTFMYLHRVIQDMQSETGEKPLATCDTDRAPQPSVATTRAPTTAGGPAYLCLTATATRPVMADLQLLFHIEHTIVCKDARQHLRLEVVNLVERNAAWRGLARDAVTGRDVASTVTSVAPPTQRVLHDAVLSAVREMPWPMLIYVQTRADADELASYLTSKLGKSAPASGAQGPDRPGSVACGRGTGVTASHLFQPSRLSAEVHSEAASAPDAPRRAGGEAEGRGRCVVRCYHAALSRQVRLSTQKQFLRDEIDVLVATVAFGMGIDKANLRSVLHAYAPSSLESYVQEIGRAGRDGQSSWCRLLYNPFDYYALRTRLRGSLVAPREMTRVVRALLGGPVSHTGDVHYTLISPAAIALSLEVSEELVETVLFLLLTCDGATSTRAAVFARVRGSCPLGLRVTHVAVGRSGGGGRGGCGDVSVNTRGDTSCAGAAATRKRSRGATGGYVAHSQRGDSGPQDVSCVLAQLDAPDPVLDYCRKHTHVANQIDAANALSLSLDDFQAHLDGLVGTGALRVSWRTSCPAYVVQVDDGFIDAASPVGLTHVAARLFAHYDDRLRSQVRALGKMFAVLQAPTHERIQAALDAVDEDDAAACDAASPWQPPPRSLRRVEAVATANAFVAENRGRLHSRYEAARALLGVVPKSLIKYGKYAGQMPLSQSWYTHSPYFGALHEFDLDWVLSILAVHHLDEDDDGTAARP